MSNTSSAYGAIVKAQWRILLRDGRLKVLAIATLLLTAVALIGGVARDSRVASERAALNAEDVDLWETQGAVNPHMAAHFGRYVSKPVSPLTFFDPGVTDQLGAVARLEAHVQQPPRHRPAEGGGALSRLGGFSPALALQLLAPLLIILAGFTAFSGEKAGTLLRQELAGGASPGSLFIGRYTALSGATLLIAAPVLAVVTLLSMQAGGDTALSALAASIGYLLYLLIWVGLTLGISGLFRSARSSLVILLSAWLLSTFVVPRLAGDVAERLSPTPSAPAFKAEVRAALEGGPSGHDSSDTRLENYKRCVLERYGVERVEDLPVAWGGLALQEGERIASETGNAHYEALWASYEEQSQTRRGFAVLSPLLALRSWSAGLAGADAAAHVDFSRALEAYRFNFVKMLNDDIAINAAGQNPWEYEAAEELLEQVPAFTYKPPTIAKRMAKLWPDLTLLAVWAALACVFALFAAKRLRPT